MTEEWRPIDGYHGAYEVSDQGRVRSLDRLIRCGANGVRVSSGRIIVGGLCSTWYRHVTLWKDNTQKTIRVNRLVAMTFIPNPLGLPEVCHIDHTTLNNRADNLEWGTHAHNMAHSAAAGRLRASTNPNRARKLNAEQVAEIRKMRADGMPYTKIAKAFGLVRETARTICIGKIWA